MTINGVNGKPRKNYATRELLRDLEGEGEQQQSSGDHQPLPEYPVMKHSEYAEYARASPWTAITGSLTTWAAIKKGERCERKIGRRERCAIRNKRTEESEYDDRRIEDVPKECDCWSLRRTELHSFLKTPECAPLRRYRPEFRSANAICLY